MAGASEETSSWVTYEWQWLPWPGSEWCDYKRYPLFSVEQALEFKPTLAVEDIPLRLVKRTTTQEIVDV